MIAFATIAFIALLVLSMFHHVARDNFKKRNLNDWILDLIGLINQGFLASLIVGWILAQLLTMILPGSADMIQLPAPLIFVLALFGIDYAFYWSHRLFHRQSLFAIHFIHHTSERMDVLATSRNTLWQPFIFPHVWLIGLSLHLFANPLPIIIALEIMGAFDYWNHSSLHPNTRWYPYLQKLFITPKAHEWHHSLKKYRTNYGNVFALWDRLHGTYYNPAESPEHLGLKMRPAPWWKMLLYPYGRE